MDPDPFAPLTLTSGRISVEVLPHGATLHRIVFAPQRGGPAVDVLAGPEKPEGHVAEGRKFLTQLVGRYANRLPGGDVTVHGKRGDISLNLEKNENARAYLHGGSRGYDLRALEPIGHGSPLVAALYGGDMAAASSPSSAFFALSSPDGDQGFPGALDVVVRVAAEASDPSGAEKTGPLGRSVGVVTYQIKAKLADGAPATGSPVNLTLHSGYRLSELAGESKLFIASGRQVEVDQASLPTGNLKPTQGTAYDVCQGSIDTSKGIPRLGDVMSKDGIDHCYVFDSTSTTSPKVLLQSPDAGTTLVFRTNQSAVQCYTAQGFDGTGTRKAIHGDVGTGYPRQGAVFLEFHQPVATCLYKALQDAAGTDTVLYPGEVYDNSFSVEIWEA